MQTVKDIFNLLNELEHHVTEEEKLIQRNCQSGSVHARLFEDNLMIMQRMKIMKKGGDGEVRVT